MPYINLNGQLIEVTQEQYDIYNIGQGVNPAAGGNVVQLNNTQTILTPNTTNNTPGQTLPTQQERIDNSSTLSGTYIGNQLFVPGQQLSKQQLAAVQLSLATGNQVDPAVLAQYDSQGGRAALAVAQANGVDTNAPLTQEQQEIFNIGQRLNGNTVGTSTVSTTDAQIADYQLKNPGVPLPTELSGLTENERQVELWEAKYPGVPAPTEYTGQSEEDRQRALFEAQYPGQTYPYDRTPSNTTDTDFIELANGDLVPVDSPAGQEALLTQEQEDTRFRYADPAEVPVETNDQNELVDLNTGEVYGIDPNSDFLASEGGLNILPEELNADEANVPDGGLVEFTDEGSIVRQPEEVSETALYGTPYDDDGNLNPGWELDGDGNPYYKGYSQGNLWINPNTAASAEASRVEAFRNQARQQQTISQQRKQINNGDWRVRLRLAPQATYLYNDPNPGILAPLSSQSGTDGIIFPYTPSIDTAYRANYSQYDLTHSNYRGYFYQNSYVDAINLRATFTAQDTAEANYLLAVITFLKSVTKMFYGQDSAALRGSPPPLTYLSGLGEYQFNEHPCLVQQFNYSLPADVDYIRAGSGLINGNNLVTQRNRQNSSTFGIVGVATRLASAFLTKGAMPTPQAPTSLGLNRPTYVPTKMEIQLTLLPVQSRQQVSKQFSLKNFSNGNLIKGGFW